MKETIRTLEEVLNKADELAATEEAKALVQFDQDLARRFSLLTLKGTTAQLMTVVQALRTAAITVEGAMQILEEEQQQGTAHFPFDKVHNDLDDIDDDLIGKA